jgi:hypothetical protein
MLLYRRRVNWKQLTVSHDIIVGRWVGVLLAITLYLVVLHCLSDALYYPVFVLELFFSFFLFVV